MTHPHKGDTLAVGRWLTVVQQGGAPPDARDRDRARALARTLRTANPGLAPPQPDDLARPGLDRAPSLVIEDHSEITLFETAGNRAYADRALLLAGDGDSVVLGGRGRDAFAAYCRDTLGLGAPERLVPAPAGEGVSLAHRCRADRKLLAGVAAEARCHGGLNILPYMGTKGVWALAWAIAEQAGVPMRVGAPPPRLVRAVNDKVWFATRVAELLGIRHEPDSARIESHTALIEHVQQVAAGHDSLVVKLPHSASGAGNLVLDAAELRRLSKPALGERLKGLLRAAGWPDRFPLLVSAWEAPVAASPSVHLWIPLAGTGAPIVEGVFDQIVEQGRIFAGAGPTALPRDRVAGLNREAMRLGMLFQELGYYGRCSFDAILVGNDAATAATHWVECNGRWGGVSIPLTLANRLTGNWAAQGFRVAERAGLDNPPRSFAEVRERVGDLLFTPARGEGAVILSPAPLETGTGFELLVLGQAPAAAEATVEAVADRLRSPV